MMPCSVTINTFRLSSKFFTATYAAIVSFASFEIRFTIDFPRVVLLPSVDEVVRRGLTREATIRVPEDLLRRGHETFLRYGELRGYTIDNTHLTAHQAADAVMDACGRGDCLVYSPG